LIDLTLDNFLNCNLGLKREQISLQNHFWKFLTFLSRTMWFP